MSAAIGALSAGFMPHAAFFSGLWVGCSLGMGIWLWDDPPEHIARWKRGSDGERRTERVLRRLDSSQWSSYHDLDAKYGNIDHVVVGPAGVFLLETKALRGSVSYARSTLRVSYTDAPRHDYEFARLEGRLRAGASNLHSKLKDETGLNPWVQAVVIVWGDFAEGESHGDRVVYLRGDGLQGWLESQEPKLNERDRRLIELGFAAEIFAKPAPAIA